MKVLLFVQKEGERPTCVPTPRWLGGSAESIQHVREMAASFPSDKASWWIQLVANADHWWLVECMSAAHGRDIIMHVEKYGEDAVQSPLGRIIASSNGRGESCPSNVVSE